MSESPEGGALALIPATSPRRHEGNEQRRTNFDLDLDPSFNDNLYDLSLSDFNFESWTAQDLPLLHSSSDNTIFNTLNFSCDNSQENSSIENLDHGLPPIIVSDQNLIPPQPSQALLDDPATRQSVTTFGPVTAPKAPMSLSKVFVCQFRGCGAKRSSSQNLAKHWRQKAHRCGFDKCRERFSDDLHREIHFGVSEGHQKVTEDVMLKSNNKAACNVSSKSCHLQQLPPGENTAIVVSRPASPSLFQHSTAVKRRRTEPAEMQITSEGAAKVMSTSMPPSGRHFFRYQQASKIPPIISILYSTVNEWIRMDVDDFPKHRISPEYMYQVLSASNPDLYKFARHAGAFEYICPGSECETCKDDFEHVLNALPMSDALAVTGHLESTLGLDFSVDVPPSVYQAFSLDCSLFLFAPYLQCFCYSQGIRQPKAVGLYMAHSAIIKLIEHQFSHAWLACLWAKERFFTQYREFIKRY